MFRLLIALASLSSGAVVLAADGFTDLPMGARVGTLKNGAQVILVPVPGDRVVVRVSVARGFGDEIVSVDPPKSEVGGMHKLEHMLFYGTREYPSKENFNREVTKNRIQTNANTDWHETNYFMIGPKESAASILSLMSSMLRSPLLKDKSISKIEGMFNTTFSGTENY